MFQLVARLSNDADWTGPRLFIPFQNEGNVGGHKLSRERVLQDPVASRIISAFNLLLLFNFPGKAHSPYLFFLKRYAIYRQLAIGIIKHLMYIPASGKTTLFSSPGQRSNGTANR